MWNWSTTMAETRDSRMLCPVHPGETILYGCLGVVGEDEGALEVAEAASKLGVPRETLQPLRASSVYILWYSSS